MKSAYESDVCVEFHIYLHSNRVICGYSIFYGEIIQIIFNILIMFVFNTEKPPYYSDMFIRCLFYKQRTYIEALIAVK